MILQVLRWKAIVPLGVLLLLLVVAWILFLDRAVERSIEVVGADLTGAKVDVASADVSLGAGRVSISGLQAANPNSPMRNLLEAEEIVADVRVGAMLRKKVIVEQVSVRGVQFGTQRTTSGALEDPSPQSGALMRRISAWSEQVRVPPLNLETLGKAVNVETISPDSLRTPQLARATVARADSLRRNWEANLRQLNPLPVIDSARSLASRLNSANPLTLGIAGVRGLAGSARNTLASVRELETGLSTLDGTVSSGVNSLETQVQQLAESRQADYRYARSLLQLPSLDSPDLSPNLFSDLAIARVERVLYWLGKAERYLPPGLNPRRFTGSERTRASGTTVEFPDESGDPDFLIESADADLVIGGEGGGAGKYSALLTGLTTQPTVYGRPMRFSVERAPGNDLGSDVEIAAVIDHVSEEIRDSLTARVEGVSLPSIDIDFLQASLNMGMGTSNISLMRAGDSVSGSWTFSSSNIEWARRKASANDARDASTARQVGRVVEDLVWSTVSGLEDVQIEIGFSGSARGPSLSIRSNVGRAIARSLRQQLGREIERAEQQVRAEVDRIVSDRVSEARNRVDALQSELDARITSQLEELSSARQELERAIRRLVPE